MIYKTAESTNELGGITAPEPVGGKFCLYHARSFVYS